MFETRTGRRGLAIAPPQTLAGSTSGGIPAGTEVVIASVRLADSGYPVLESLYINGDSNSPNALRFRATLDGSQIGRSWALPTPQPKGQAGVPQSIGENMPNGRLLEIRCLNSGSDSTLNAYSDGEVQTYDRPV